jgi:spore coat protein U-like protein
MKHANHVKSATVAAVILVVAGMFAPMFASAQTATATLAVSATVAPDCSITANPLAFGSYSGAVNNVSTTIAVSCSNTTGYTVGLSAGSGSGATVTNRLMTLSGGSQTLGYGLYQDSGHATNWGNASGSWESGTGSGSAQTLTVYGQIAAGQFPTPGSYADSVTVTITY